MNTQKAERHYSSDRNNYISLNMKQLVIFLSIIFGICPHASAIDLGDDRGMTLSAFFGINQRHYYESDLPNDPFNEFDPVITGRIGYRFNNKWEAGAFYRQERCKGWNHYYGIGVYGEWSFFRFSPGFRLIAEGHASYNIADHNDHWRGYPFYKNMTEVGIIPCIAFRIPHSPVDIKLLYLFIGFNDSFYLYKSDAPGCLGRGDWIIDASLRRLEIGASITF